MQYKDSGNKWKEKCRTKSKIIKSCKREIRRLKKNRNKWKRGFKALASSAHRGRLKGHQYPLELIWLGIYMRIVLNVSLRGVSRSLQAMGLILGLELEGLSSTTIRNWSLKYGYYKLKKDLCAGEYVLICDESIVIGQEQVLLVLAVPIGEKSYISPLEMADVHVLEVKVQRSWKSKEIAACIKGKTDKIGITLSYVISDNGVALNGAYKLCGLKKVEDCTHIMANILKALYQKNASFLSLIKQMNAVRAKWIKSKYILYIPPTLRTKSRFHQLFSMGVWGQQMLNKWSKMPEIVQNELFFLKEQAVFIEEMSTVNNLVKTLSAILKSKGITKFSQQKCEKVFTDIEANTDYNNVKEFIKKMRIYIIKQKELLPDKEQILCTSDIIESMFGKFKNKKNAHDVLTDDVLTIAAFGGNMGFEEVEMACLNTKIKDIQKWKSENTVPSIIALKKQFKAT